MFLNVLMEGDSTMLDGNWNRVPTVNLQISVLSCTLVPWVFGVNWNYSWSQCRCPLSLSSFTSKFTQLAMLWGHLWPQNGPQSMLKSKARSPNCASSTLGRHQPTTVHPVLEEFWVTGLSLLRHSSVRPLTFCPKLGPKMLRPWTVVTFPA